MDEIEPTFENPEQWPGLLTTEEVAKLLRLTKSTLMSWCASGAIDAVQISKTWRISREAVWAVLPQATIDAWGDGPWVHARERAQQRRREQGRESPPGDGGEG
ncbi:MAG: helix-turn-helix domain-containing protein [Solirubrobacteraceae bacterium]